MKGKEETYGCGWSGSISEGSMAMFSANGRKAISMRVMTEKHAAALEQVAEAARELVYLADTQSQYPGGSYAYYARVQDAIKDMRQALAELDKPVTPDVPNVSLDLTNDTRGKNTQEGE